MTIENNIKTDVSKESSEDKSLPNIDRIALLSDTTSGANVRSSDKIFLGKEFNPLGYKPSASQEDSDKSVMDKSYPDNSDKNSTDKDNNGQLSNDKNTRNDDANSKSNKVKIEYATILGSTGDDPKKPTVAFLDFFAGGHVPIAETARLNHGSISQLAADAHGYNTIAIQQKAPVDEYGDADLSKVIDDVDKKIDNGQLKLTKGDAVNISLGNPDPTFDEASEFLGFEVNRENLAQNREKILKEMANIKGDPQAPEDMRQIATRVLATNAAIDRIQAKGIDVVHAAGNDGPDRFSWDFMEANVQLSSASPNGKVDSFSADHSLTQKEDGVIPLTWLNEGNLISKIPIAEQRGRIELGDTGVKFDYKGSDSVLSNNLIFNRDTYSVDKAPDKRSGEIKTPQFMFDPEKTKQSPFKYVSRFVASEETARENHNHVLTFSEADVAGYVEPGRREDLTKGEKPVIAVAPGTSFSNINYFKHHYQEYLRRKNSW